jgi:uncharacterized protein
MLRHPVRVAVLAAALLIFFGTPSFVGLYTDWLWFQNAGYPQVFTTMFSAQGTLFTMVFVVAALWLTFNLRIALAGAGEGRPIFITREGIEVALPGRRQMQTLASLVAVLAAVVVGLYGSGQWETWLAWRHAVPFGQADPITGHDVGFFIFTLPFLRFVHGIAQALLVLAAFGSGVLYFFTGSLTPGFPVRPINPAARRHFIYLAAVFFVLLAVGAWINRFEFLVQPSGQITGASYADVNARMPIAFARTAIAAVGAVLAVYAAATARTWPVLTAGALYLLVAAGGGIYATLLQRFAVGPNEQVWETPYIRHNIEGTRRAFALDTVDVRELSGNAELSRDDIARNRATLDNVRLWDHAPLKETFGQLQEIRTYYDFAGVDNDRYRVNGALRQVMLSARELNSNSLQNRTWVNERLSFTHGYGLTLGPVNQVSGEGLPVLFIRNMPPETEAGFRVDEPSIYFGELSNDYVIVRTKAAEFHYPSGDQNVTTRYSGRAGVALDSLWRKAVFALRFGAYQILLSSDIDDNSRILYHRNIRTRVQEIAPFLTFDNDPYIVLADGRLYWMYDAYTTSTLYPYSSSPRPGGVNYIRNAVKFVIDAYEGTTTAYLADDKDPIAATYARIFPGMFKPLSDMPRPLREHVRYPEDLFALQSSVFATYHMTDPTVFYNREDQWQVPTLEEGGQGVGMQPYYTVMRLPGEQEAEFIQMLPFTPRRRDNLAAWLVARSDIEHYGQLMAFEFPKQKLVFGPRQVVGRINQDQTISPVITLWNQQGSQVIWGTLMVIPIEESLIYVRPLYLRGAGGQIPELRRVVVAYQNQIVMEPTLDAALARLFGGSGAPPAPGQAPAPSAAPSTPVTRPAGQAAPASAESMALAAEARAHYERAIEAQRAGDWAKYGEEIRLLGEALQRLSATPSR